MSTASKGASRCSRNAARTANGTHPTRASGTNTLARIHREARSGSDSLSPKRPVRAATASPRDLPVSRP